MNEVRRPAWAWEYGFAIYRPYPCKDAALSERAFWRFDTGTVAERRLFFSVDFK